MLLRDMVEDPRTKMLVDPDWAELPEPTPPVFVDGIALERIAPDRDTPDITVAIGNIYDPMQARLMPPLYAQFELASVTVAIT
jgi:hypothetical protein